MKTMTCKELGGACNFKIHANTFEEMAEQSKAHGMRMFQAGDEAHLQAMKEMQELMQSPDAMSQWFEDKRKLFNSLPDVD